MTEVDVLVDVDEAVIQPFPNGWNLVTFGCWQVSVSPDGLVRLPYSVLPDTVGDLVEALRVASEVGLAVRAENEAREAAAPRRPGIASRGGLVIQEGPPPEGAVRLPVAPRLMKG